MAIEWYLSDASPVHSVTILQHAEEISEVLGCGQFDFSISKEKADLRAADETDGEFFWELPVYALGTPTMVMITASHMVDDAESEVPSALIFGTVLAGRTRISAVLGIITALSWFRAAGGMLSGTGLIRHHSGSEFDSLIRSFSPPPGVPFDVAIQHISGLVLGNAAELPYA